MTRSGSPSRVSVFLDHDGGIDDFLSLLMVLTYDHVDLLGISVTPADTMAEAAVPATRKILDLAGVGVPVAGGTLQGPNPFPLQWRTDAFKVNDLPILNQRPEIRAPLSDLPGQELLARTLQEAPGPVTLLWTGPLTNLAWALERHPGIEPRVEQLVLMAGALEVPGNVEEVEGHDRTAEWNVYWDPPAAKRVWDSSIPITLFPLDATDSVPVTSEFRRAFGLQYRYPFSAAAGTMWAITSAWEVLTGRPYFCWDTLTTSYLAIPDAFEFREVRCDVVTRGASEGRTILADGGRPVRAAMAVDVDRFYRHCLETLRR